MSSQLPPQPKAVLRGHHAQVHAAAFVRENQRLASGDAEGYVVLWDLTIVRPRAVWRAHTNAILGIASWGADKIITHGRDNQLIIWKLAEEDEASLSTTLPLDPSPSPRPQPWVLFILPVNTMNFCSFGFCPANDDGTTEELLVAVPNTLASESVDIYHFPSQKRLHTVASSPKDEKTGMVMSLVLCRVKSGALTLVTGYENGLAMVTQQSGEEGGTTTTTWDVSYRSQAHGQPILSLDVSPSRDFFYTSGADANVVKHPIPQQTSAYSTPETPTSSPASAEPNVPTNGLNNDDNSKPAKPISLLSAALASAPRPAPVPQKQSVEVKTQPSKVVNTKHSGQQGLQVRSDGKIFATAGWDSKIRVYSAKTLQELAVLKWHQVGCYTIAFASLDRPPTAADDGKTQNDKGSGLANDQSAAVAKTVVPKLVDVTVKDRRIKQAKETHWLAAGSKDGKISLWDIY
ncbi:WD repeat-containing protein [Apiospora kogelbergensis]|uniref:ASTRA-associated protein 1 n=1 Tax=Apiospora kogelbergensis TaxID=1337665 RepID=A0AAW0QGB9_9PEZI